MKVVIIGGTGLVGSNVISKLLADKKFEELTSITRRKVDLKYPQYQNIVLDEFESREIENLEVDGKIFICCLGTTIKTAGSKDNFRKVDKDFVVSFSKLAKKNNAQKLYIVSATGADENSYFFYSKTKGEMEREVIKINNNHTIFLRPSLLIGEREEHRAAEKFAIKTYQLIKNIIPKILKDKIATEVVDISNYIKNDLDKESFNRVDFISSFS